MRTFYIIISLLLIFPLHSQNVSDQYTIYDYFKMTGISDPQFSPDGEKVACLISQREKWDGQRVGNIWVIRADGKSRFQLTNSDKGNWRPRWSPDGKRIAFMSGRAEKPQVFVIEIEGGEARQLSEMKEGIRMFEWINNSKIAMVSNSIRDSILVKREKKGGGGYVVGTEYRKSVLWVQITDFKTKPVKIVSDKFHIASMAASKDGERFALVISTDSELYKQITANEILVIDDSGDEVYRFKEGKGFGNIGFSPDGSKVSFSANIVGFSSNSALFVGDLNLGSTVNLTKEFDPTISTIQWLDRKSIIFSTPRNVYTGIYSVTLDGNIKTVVNPYWVAGRYSIDAKNSRIVYTASRSNIPGEMYIQDLGAQAEKATALTQLNTWISEKKLASTKVVSFPAADGQTIEAIVALPPGYSVDEKYPLLVMPHGGPDGIAMDNFHVFHQLFALEGIIVYRPNFRGGIGYGNDFYEANRGKLGYIDYDDIMAGLDFLIKTESVDTTQLLVGGWSYGGYMTNWMIGHTNRFKAAVSVAGIANTVSMYAQSDINHGELARWEFKGVPVLHMENYTRSSPLTFLRNCKTPTLIIHGEADNRVPVAQAWEIYRALVDLKVETELVLYPDAHHGIRPPKQFSDVVNRWIAWYQKYLKDE